MENSGFYVTAFYHFTPLQDLETHKAWLVDRAVDLGVRGLVILGLEGFNSTCAAPSEDARASWEALIQEHFNCQVEFKHSGAESPPFRRFSVKIRPEIVTAGRPDLRAQEGENHHLSPQEWNRVLKEEEDYVLVDTRNWYEYEMGTFQGARNPQTEKFTDFFDQVEDMNLPKDKKLLIFCTGGIRCHKGILELQDRGYSNVWQLKGGILNYLKEFPRDQFQGECFVFDHRVALDQDLKPTKKFGLCPHCGDPAQHWITCRRCGTETRICTPCSGQDTRKLTCSRNCHHHYLLHPERKAQPQGRGLLLRRPGDSAPGVGPVLREPAVVPPGGQNS